VAWWVTLCVTSDSGANPFEIRGQLDRGVRLGFGAYCKFYGYYLSWNLGDFILGVATGLFGSRDIRLK
jgi:hypothetical protein